MPKNKMTKTHYFEMGHTASIFSDMVDRHLTDVYTDEKLNRKCAKVADLLAEIYQEAMAKA